MSEAVFPTTDSSDSRRGLFPAGGDLSDRLGPMTVKELRQGTRRVSFVIPFLAIHLLAILTTFVEFKAGGVGMTSERPGLLNVWLLVSSGPFWFVVSLICAVVMPLGGLTMMTGELEGQNHELLLLTTLNRWQVVRGKFFTLWGMCVLTFVSLLPYVVVRYLVGGIEPLQELACSGSVIALSGMVSAGALGASGFLGIGKRIFVLVLFLASMGAACAPPLVATTALPGGYPIVYHITALVAFFSYVVFGLALARSRMRLAVQSYEVKPSLLILGIIFFAPPAVWMATAMSLGYAGCVALAFMTFLAFVMDPPSGSASGTQKSPATPASLRG